MSTAPKSDVGQGGMIRVGDLARKTGKTVRAIHLYEELGLLKPASRSSGGFRLYEAATIDRVRWIDLLHEMGFSLQEMRDVLRAWWSADLGPDAMDRLRGLFQAKLVEARRTIERHRQIESELLEGLAYLEACKVCSTHEASSECVRCTQDHGMESEPALLAGIMNAPERRTRSARARTGQGPGFVGLEEIGLMRRETTRNASSGEQEL